MPSRCGAVASGIIASALVGVSSCSDPIEPRWPEPTLLVENLLCDSMGCQAMYIRAYVWAFPVPQGTMRGAMPLGRVDGPTGCIRFPPEWTLTVQEVDSLGMPTGPSTTFEWTPDHPEGIYLIALSEHLEPTHVVGTTRTFVPAAESGWTVTFSSEPDSITGDLSPAEPCEPENGGS
jgi:hypothetical protein